MTTCCSGPCAAIEKKFDEAMARRELAKYLKNGPGPTTKLLRDGVMAAGVTVETLLDVGTGIGALTFELLERGVRRAVGVDASGASVAAATAEAHRRKRADRAEWVHGDFVAVADQLAPADAVTLDRATTKCSQGNLEKRALEFFDRLNILPGTRLLDVGCGAVDLAANLVLRARIKAADEGLKIQVDEGDAEDLPYPDASFDVVRDSSTSSR